MSVLCIGAAHLDHRGVVRGPAVMGTSNRGDVHTDLGGVARNVAENLVRLGCPVGMLSRLGQDAPGDRVLGSLKELGIDTSLVTRSPSRPTASYTAILENSGELVIGLNDADIYEEVTRDVVEPNLARMREHEHWFLDTNLHRTTIELLAQAHRNVYADGVSVERVLRLRRVLTRVSVLFTNVAQVGSVFDRELRDAEAAASLLQEHGVRAGVVTNGAAGAVAWDGETSRKCAAIPAHPRDVTGAGDALAAGTIYGLTQGMALLEAVPLGLAAAAITVESPRSVAPELSLSTLQERACTIR